MILILQVISNQEQEIEGCLLLDDVFDNFQEDTFGRGEDLSADAEWQGNPLGDATASVRVEFQAFLLCPDHYVVQGFLDEADGDVGVGVAGGDSNVVFSGKFWSILPVILSGPGALFG